MSPPCYIQASVTPLRLLSFALLSTCSSYPLRTLFSRHFSAAVRSRYYYCTIHRSVYTSRIFRALLFLHSLVVLLASFALPSLTPLSPLIFDFSLRTTTVGSILPELRLRLVNVLVSLLRPPVDLCPPPLLKPLAHLPLSLALAPC